MLSNKSTRPQFQLAAMMLASLMLTWMAGCRTGKSDLSLPQCEPCDQVLQRIEYPDLVDPETEMTDDVLSVAPMTISTFQEAQSWELTVDDCVRLALQNSKVMQKLGGVVVNSPQAATTLVDQAIIETNPIQSPEAALSAFDTQLSTSLYHNYRETVPNNPFAFNQSWGSAWNAELSKQTAAGTQFTIRNQIDYSRNASETPNPFIPFTNAYNWLNQLEVRQPLRRNAGPMVNRIAGPNGIPGQYNGVLIARIRSDISLADFEAAVRDLVRDVETNYWELYFAYRDLDTKITARDASRETWENRKLRLENGLGRPDDEAQARQTYLNFKAQAENALVGLLNGQPGVLGAERNLRRLLGLRVNDGRIIRPISEPSTAPVVFDWDQSQMQTLQRRIELRRQRWTIRQRELELLAAKALNRWNLDLVSQFGFIGFGENLFGSRSQPQGSAFNSLREDDLNSWQVGFEWGGPIGNRRGHLAVRNAQLSLSREKTLFKEQQRQVLHDLGAAFAEVDRAMVNLRTIFNSRIAVQQELEPKRLRAERGQDQIFFLLDAIQRAATAESAVHRSIADYNQALLNYAYVSGSLLSRFNIELTEGPWCEDAQIDARERAFRFVNQGPNCDMDTCPVSLGPYDQRVGPPVMQPGMMPSEGPMVPADDAVMPDDVAPSELAPIPAPPSSVQMPEEN